MNKTNTGAHYGFTQYCYPKDYELSGKKFVLKGDADTYVLEFLDRGFVNYSDVNGEILSQYEALKVDDRTHIVFFGEYITTAVLDLENGYAVISDPRCTGYCFCEIDGMCQKGQKPGYTEEMTGTHVKWYFGNGRYLENTYEEGTCTCVWSPRTDRARKAPAKYVKVKDGVYLCQFDSTSPFRSDIPQGFSKIIMLQCYRHLETVGCIYSPALNEWLLISGYAMPPET